MSLAPAVRVMAAQGNPQLGFGYDSRTGSFRNRCVTGDSVTVPEMAFVFTAGAGDRGSARDTLRIAPSGQQVTYAFHEVTSRERLREELNVSAEFAVRGLLSGGSAAAAWSRSHDINRFALTYVGTEQVINRVVRLPHAQLADFAVRAAKTSSTSFANQCGDFFVVGAVLGGMLDVRSTIEFESIDERRQAQASLRGFSGPVSGAVELSSKFSHLLARNSRTGTVNLLGGQNRQSPGDSNAFQLAIDSLSRWVAPGTKGEAVIIVELAPYHQAVNWPDSAQAAPDFLFLAPAVERYAAMADTLADERAALEYFEQHPERFVRTETAPAVLVARFRRRLAADQALLAAAAGDCIQKATSKVGCTVPSLNPINIPPLVTLPSERVALDERVDVYLGEVPPLVKRQVRFDNGTWAVSVHRPEPIEGNNAIPQNHTFPYPQCTNFAAVVLVKDASSNVLETACLQSWKIPVELKAQRSRAFVWITMNDWRKADNIPVPSGSTAAATLETVR